MPTKLEPTPEQEERLRAYAVCDFEGYGEDSVYVLLRDLGRALPPPAYVPEVGDVVRVWQDDDNETAVSYETGEAALTVTNTLVVTFDEEDDSPRPEVWAYRIDAHRFEKVEQ